jgi:hypothetical protein
MVDTRPRNEYVEGVHMLAEPFMTSCRSCVLHSTPCRFYHSHIRLWFCLGDQGLPSRLPSYFPRRCLLVLTTEVRLQFSLEATFGDK